MNVSVNGIIVHWFVDIHETFADWFYFLFVEVECVADCFFGVISFGIRLAIDVVLSEGSRLRFLNPGCEVDIIQDQYAQEIGTK